MRLPSYLLIPLLVSGCAQHIRSLAVDYQFLDQPSKSRIELTYHNLSDSPVCMSPETWPNDKGEVGMPGKYFILIVGGREFPVDETQFDFCPRCVYFVLPGEKVTAHVPYSSFSLPSSLANEEKVLRYQPSGFKCKVPKGCVPNDKIDLGTWTGSSVKGCRD